MNTSITSPVAPGTRILFANFPADGHFNPLTGLAAHLKSIGCDVRWYTSTYYEKKIAALKIPFYPLKRAIDVSAHTDLEAIFPDRKKHKGQVAKLKFDMIHAFVLRAPEYYDDILEIYEEFPFQLMIADITFGAIPFVKEKMNIPVMSIGVVPLPETSKDLPPSGLGLTPSYSFAGKIKQSILRFLADKILFAHPTKVMKQMLAEHGIDTGNANIFDILIRKSTLLLQSGTPGFEYKRSDRSAHIHFAGPLLPYSVKKERKAWTDKRLSRYNKVILVTQGTVEKDVEKLLVPTIEALRGTGCLVIATTGGSKTEELRARYPDPNVIIEDFIPFDDVMPHADVYVSNGGYGGVLLSIKHKLPMVVAGVHEGKNEINARVGYFGLGINMKTEHPSVEALRKSINTVLHDKRFSKNVEQLSHEFSSYLPEQICAYYVAKLTARSRKIAQRKKQPEASADFIY